MSRRRKPQKKVLLLVVEGYTDKQALEISFHEMFDSNETRVCVTDGDITSDPHIEPRYVIAELGNKVKESLEEYMFDESDLAGIIHIIDTDGAFIPNDAVVEYPGMEGTSYSTTRIMTHNRMGIIDRNEHK